MGVKEIESKARQLREIQALIEEAQEEVEALKDEIKAAMWGCGALPTHEEISFGMPEEASAAFREVQEQITGARFVTPLDALMVSVLSQCEMMGNNVDETALSEIVEKAYTDMKMMLAES